MQNASWGGSEELWYKFLTNALVRNCNVHLCVFDNMLLSDKIQKLKDELNVFVLPSYVKTKRNVFVAYVYEKLGIRPKSIKSRFEFLNLHFYDHIIVSLGYLLDLHYLRDLNEFLRHSKSKISIVNQYMIEFGHFEYQERNSVASILNIAQFNLFVSYRNLLTSERLILQKISNYHIVDNPLNLDKMELMPFKDSDQKVCFASVSRLEVQVKGQDILLQAFSSEIWKNRNWSLFIYGAGSQMDYLVSLANFYGLSDKVVFKGNVADITKVWSECDVHLHPSLSEGMPLSVVESMACGRPVLASDVGDVSTVVKSGETGYLIPYPTLPVLTDALETVWNTRHDWKRMGINAHNLVKQRYSVDQGEVMYNLLFNN